MTSYLDPRNLEDAMKEIRYSRKTNEALRQRVKELEEDNQRIRDHRNHYRAELAALKAEQGEPVAVVNVQGGGMNPVVSWIRTGQLHAGSHKLYTSAPTIPEGWQDFLKNGIKIMRALIAKSDCSIDRNEEFYLAAQWEGKAKAMLSSAPKQGE